MMLRFGRRSEQLDPDRLQLGLADLEQAVAEGGAAQDAAAQSEEQRQQRRAARPRRNHGALPAHLPRHEGVIDVDGQARPCCSGVLHLVGEDRTEQLDVVPAQLRVRVTRRPRHGCRACEGAVVQAPAPDRLLDGGMAAGVLVAHIAAGKFCDALPLHRQAGMLAELYAIEAESRGHPAERRAQVRHDRSRPVVDALHIRLQDHAGCVSAASDLAKAVRCALRHWDGLRVFLDDGRVGMDTNVVERVVSPKRAAFAAGPGALTCKNALLAGSGGGGRSWAMATTLIRTAKLNGVEPMAWLADVLERIVSGRAKAHGPHSLLPWNWRAASGADLPATAWPTTASTPHRPAKPDPIKTPQPPLCPHPAPATVGDAWQPTAPCAPATMRTSASTAVGLELGQPRTVHHLSAAWSSDPGNRGAAAPLATSGSAAQAATAAPVSQTVKLPR